MILKDAKVKLSEIYLDPYNPRFIIQTNESQDKILDKIFNSKDAKELLNSMKINIKWVNKIVIIHKSNFSQLQNGIVGIDSTDYLVIEGNNRLACLKSGKIEGIDNNTEIPVIIAQKEDIETREEYELQLRVTQGIANVMVVKEWSVISKARHLFNMYNDLKTNDTFATSSPHEIYKRISDELGVGSAEVRKSFIRYEFYTKINDISDKIPDDHWGYLEAFDRNKNLRSKFGMSQENNIIDLDEDDDGVIEEILKEIPSLIKKAAGEGINTKQFRDIINEEISAIDSSDDLLEFIQHINEKESEYSFKSRLSKKSKLTEEEKWAKILDEINEDFELFPNMSSWSNKMIVRLKKIQKLLEDHISILEK